MKCPKCGGIKQLTPESRRTETSVWRRRVCKMCHHIWLTEEVSSSLQKMPTEVAHFLDKVMRHTPKHAPKKQEQSQDKSKTFDTSGLSKIQW